MCHHICDKQTQNIMIAYIIIEIGSNVKLLLFAGKMTINATKGLLNSVTNKNSKFAGAHFCDTLLYMSKNVSKLTMCIKLNRTKVTVNCVSFKNYFLIMQMIDTNPTFMAKN